MAPNETPKRLVGAERMAALQALAEERRTQIKLEIAGTPAAPRISDNGRRVTYPGEESLSPVDDPLERHASFPDPLRVPLSELPRALLELARLRLLRGLNAIRSDLASLYRQHGLSEPALKSAIAQGRKVVHSEQAPHPDAPGLVRVTHREEFLVDPAAVDAAIAEGRARHAEGLEPYPEGSQGAALLEAGVTRPTPKKGRK